MMMICACAHVFNHFFLLILYVDCYRGNGTNYMGNVARTRFGLTCSLWDQNIQDLRRFVQNKLKDEHLPIYKDPDISKLKKNYCRNPDDDAHGPWCYTSDPEVPWDYCPISRCEDDAISMMSSLDRLPSVEGEEKSLPWEGLVVRAMERPQLVMEEVIGSSGAGTWLREEPRENSLLFINFILLIYKGSMHLILHRYNLNDYQAWLGIHNVERAHEEKHKQVLNISQLVYGPQGSDLVLLKLSRPAVSSDAVAIIRLPISGCTIPEGTTCSVYGWGHTGRKQSCYKPERKHV
ncbi:hypothetical protein JD844_027568 [Phrynosoma platyrhinos]|uniref:Kringle domain-containing protein n=1 Tax=Phrynosoma platyrhinos TaxID=52577 RepID=A0ABQ7SGK6_PHRPL|nr:hypothetical protein JD844_027568 [Phrynosoma platyrhinos]